MIARNDGYLLDFLRSIYFPLKLPADATREDYETTLAVFYRWHQSRCDFAPWSITPELIGEYLHWLVAVKGDSGQCAAKHRRILRAVLRVAMKRRKLSIDLDEIPRPKVKNRHPRAWSVEQAERLVATARTLPGYVGPWPMRDWLPALMFTCMSTDWRISAVMHLKMSDTSLTERFAISLEGKQHKERCAKLTPQCVDALRAIWRPREEVFGDWPYDRHSRQWQALNDLLGRVIQLAGVPDIGRWHAFRKTATTMVADRLGRDEAARFAGHSDRRVTDAHYVDDSKLSGPSPADVLPRLRDGTVTPTDAAGLLDWL